MQQLSGRGAFVTGGASGIGLALGEAFAEAGMRVVLADIETGALDAAVGRLRDRFPDMHGLACDVTDPASVERAADAALEAIGNIHVVCNNAGVSGGSGAAGIALDTWRWVLDVNLMGVVHGVQTFLPRMCAHGEGGHFVNTASMAGLISGLGFGPYTAGKFAVVGLSEGLRAELAPLGIGVTVLCPGFVRTRITESARNRPTRYGPASMPDPRTPAGAMAAQVAALVQAGLDPAAVAARVVAAVRDDALYVITHADPELRMALEGRFAAILAAMDEAAGPS